MKPPAFFLRLFRRRDDDAPSPAVWALTALAAVALVTASVLAYRMHELSFRWFNQNRIQAVAEKAQRSPGSVTVVALGPSRLRMATLDEREMADLGAGTGLDRLHFLRIVRDSAEFADFEPMLDEIVALRPAMLLLDIDLLFKQRRALVSYHGYLLRLVGTVTRGTPYEVDQVNLQYGRSCLDAADDERRAAEEARHIDFRADSPAYARVRAFAERARAAGIRVALVHLRGAAAAEERAFGVGNDYKPDALARLEADRGVDVWRFPDRLHRADSYCDSASLAPAARAAASAWLVGRVAAALGEQPRVEEVSLK